MQVIDIASLSLTDPTRRLGNKFGDVMEAYQNSTGFLAASPDIQEVVTVWNYAGLLLYSGNIGLGILLILAFVPLGIIAVMRYRGRSVLVSRLLFQLCESYLFVANGLAETTLPQSFFWGAGWGSCMPSLLPPRLRYSVRCESTEISLTLPATLSHCRTRSWAKNVWTISIRLQIFPHFFLLSILWHFSLPRVLNKRFSIGGTIRCHCPRH